MTWSGLGRLLMFILFRERNEAPVTFWRRFPSGLLVVVIVTLINGGCYQLGMFEKWEWTDSDKLLRNSPARPGRVPTALILISDDDYRDLFHNRSPLASDPLLDLLDGVCQFRPAAVGLDILTGEWKQKDLEQANQRLASIKATNCQIVWIRDAVQENSGSSSGDDAQDNSYFRLGRVVGSDGPPHGLCTALPVFDPDSDGVIRRYQAQVAAALPGEERIGQYVTLPKALTSPGDCGFLVSSDPSRAKPQKIRFSDNARILRLPARQLIETLRESGGAFREEMLLRLRGSIVIIGGSYRYARDRYSTPIGSLLGAEILANAVQTVDNPIKDVSLSRLLSVEFAVEALLLACVTALNLRLPWALALAGVLAVLAAFVVSWFLFNYAGYFIGVCGAMVGVVIGIIGEVVYEPVCADIKRWRERLRSFLAKERRV